MKQGAEVALAIVYVAAVFVLVRPGSQGPTLVSSITNGFTNSIKAATGGGTWSQA
jgi:Na+/H+-translocating membrane pyrophosphatase